MVQLKGHRCFPGEYIQSELVGPDGLELNMSSFPTLVCTTVSLGSGTKIIKGQNAPSVSFWRYETQAKNQNRLPTDSTVHQTSSILRLMFQKIPWHIACKYSHTKKAAKNRGWAMKRNTFIFLSILSLIVAVGMEASVLMKRSANKSCSSTNQNHPTNQKDLSNGCLCQ